jgi:hypothetical protein
MTTSHIPHPEKGGGVADFLSFFVFFRECAERQTMLGGRSLIRILGPMGIPLARWPLAAGRLPALGTVLYNSISRVLYSESLLFLSPRLGGALHATPAPSARRPAGEHTQSAARARGLGAGRDGSYQAFQATQNAKALVSKNGGTMGHYDM